MRKKAACSIVIFLAFMVFMPTTAFTMDTRASDRFFSYDASLSVGGNGDLNIYFFVMASDTMDVLGTSKIAVQRYNGSRWVTEATLTAKDVPEMQKNNAVRHSATISYEPDYPGSKYQAVVTFYAKDSSGSSTAQKTT